MKTGMTPHDLYSLNLITEASISPDGGKVVYSITKAREEEQDYSSTLSLASRRGTELAEPFFSIPNASHPVWDARSEKICYLSSAGENGGSATQLWIYSLAEQHRYPITTMRYGGFDPIWSPDSKKIYFLSEAQPNDSVQTLTTALTQQDREQLQKEAEQKPKIITKLLFRLEGTGYLTEKRTHLWQVTLQTGAVERLVSGNENLMDPAVSADGRYLVFVSEPEENPDCNPLRRCLWLLDTQTGKSRVLLDSVGLIEKPVICHGGEQILFVGHDAQYGWGTIRQIYIYSLADQTLRSITEQFGLAVTDTAISDLRGTELPFRMLLDETEQCVYFLCSKQGNTSVYRCSFAGEVELVLGGKRQIYHMSMDAQFQRMVFCETSPTVPGDLSLYDRLTGEESKLTQCNRSLLEERDCLAPEEFTFTCDGMQQTGWILKPKGFQADKKYPSILEIHGGPQMMYANNFMLEFQILASLGYVVYYSNPRGSSGYGQTYMRAIRRSQGGDFPDYRDLMASTDLIQSLDYIDPTRMFVTGGSYGGYMTNWIVCHTNRFRAAVTQRSISNIRSYILNSDYGYCKPELEYEFDYRTEKQEADRISPVTYADQVETPLLILHSAWDLRCTLEQAIQWFVELKLRRKTVELRIFPRSNHGLARGGLPSLRIERFHCITEWFEKQ